MGAVRRPGSVPSRVSVRRGVVLVSLLVACGDEPAGSSETTPPRRACAEGWETTPEGDACRPVVAHGACAAGTMPKLGEPECQPVGTPACAEGFAADPSGWGCVAVAAKATCEGASREALGSEACVPVGDCSGAFPPAGATHVVRAGGGAAYARIGDALAAAPAGSVVAVDRGTYRESLNVTRAVRIVGRCAGEVTLEATAAGTGINVAAAGVFVSGMTLRGQTPGILVRSGSLDLEDAILEDQNSMAVDGGPGTRIRIARSVVRRVVPFRDFVTGGIGTYDGVLEIQDSVIQKAAYSGVVANGSRARVSLRGVVIRDGEHDDNGMGGSGLTLAEGAQATVIRSWLHGNRRAGYLGFRKTVGTIEDSVVDGTRPRGRVSGRETHGEGVTVGDGAEITIERSTIARNEGIGLRALLGSQITIRDSVVRDQRAEAGGDLGAGAYVHRESRLAAQRTAFVENRRAAVEIHDAGSEIVLEDSLLAATGSSLDGKQGLGLYVSEGRGQMSGTAIVGNRHTGIYLWEATAMEIERSVIRETAAQESPAILGHGILVQGVPHVLVTDSEVSHSEGIGLVFSESTAAIFGTWIAANGVGLHVQDGSELEEAAALPEALTPLSVVIGTDTRFSANGSRLGAGVVPLADPLDDL
jgi:hypothetical protein